MPQLLSPITLRDLTCTNRAWVSPMCMYSVEAQDGAVTGWHVTHYETYARGGFGLVVTEATAVAPEGRISPQDAGLWEDGHVDAWRAVTDAVHRSGGAIAVQLAHAGRKAGTYRGFPGEPRGPLPMPEGWQPVGPTDQPFPGLNTPRGLTGEELAAVPGAFAAAAARAVQAGFDAVEVHGAHGYLLHQLYSPLSNTRADGWGGDFDGRTRLVRETCAAVRAAVPDGMPVLLRISGTDWVEGGWGVEDSVRLAGIVRSLGVDLVDCSSGGNTASAGAIPVAPGYQVAIARAVRDGAGVPTGAVGLIETAEQAEEVLTTGGADAVLLGRAALRDPFWPLRAAHELGVPVAGAGWAPQYVRGAWR